MCVYDELVDILVEEILVVVEVRAVEEDDVTCCSSAKLSFLLQD